MKKFFLIVLFLVILFSLNVIAIPFVYKNGGLLDNNNNQIVRDSNGNIFIAYVMISGIGIANSSDDGNTWSNQSLTTAAAQAYPNLIIDSNDNLFVLYTNQAAAPDTILGFNSTDSGKTWTSFKAFDKPNNDTENIDCAIDNSNIIHCCSTTGTSNSDVVYYHNSSPWNTTTLVSGNQADNTDQCDIEVNEDNCPFIVGRGFDQADIDIWSPCLNGWGDSNRISIHDDVDVRNTVLNIHNNTHMYTSWWDTQDLWFANSSDGGNTWSAKEIDSDGSVNPTIGTTLDGKIYITYGEWGQTSNSYYSNSSDNGLTWDIRNSINTGINAIEYLDIQDSMYPIQNRFNDTLRVAISNGSGTGWMIYYWNLSLVSTTTLDYFDLELPDSIGYGYNLTINATIIDSDTVNTVTAEITYPNSTKINYTMSDIGSNKYQYNVTDTWNWGTHNIIVYYNDSLGNILTNISSFDVNISAIINVQTIFSSYNVSDKVNLTDPPTFGLPEFEINIINWLNESKHRYIIEFNDEPMLQYKDIARAESENSFIMRFLSWVFGDGIHETNINLKIKSHDKGILKDHKKVLKELDKEKAIYEFKTTMNGLVLNLTAAEAEQIRELKFIKKVTKEGNHTIYMDDSKIVHNITRIWEQLNSSGSNITGKGIRVAVLDSGIDYTHRFFGNCSLENLTGGNCERIEYGYDFYSNDNDPFDDMGHGTHVSGIIGGYDENNIYTGNAYNVTFLEYKVCSAGGNCPDGDIIAAIENATNLGVDLIHFSLGEQTYIDLSALGTSLQTAYDNGIIIVASAGNSYHENTIGCPSCLPFVISVGSVTKSDTASPFTSKGHAFYSNGSVVMKPDIMAVGSSVKSSVPTGGCALCDSSGIGTLSGTSMSAPQVTGIIALLKQGNPDWSVQQIKSALMTNSKDLGYLTTTQGSGRVNAFKSFNTSATVIPYKKYAPENVGSSDKNYSSNFTFTLIGLNRNGTYTISFTPSGFNATSNVTTIDINTSNNVTIRVNLTKDNSIESNGFEEMIMFVNSSTDSYRIPIELYSGVNPVGCPVLGTSITSDYTMPSGITCQYLLAPYNGILRINDDNLTLDCNNSWLIGSKPMGNPFDYSDVGINGIDRDNVTIKNCKLSNFQAAIQLSGDDNHFFNNTIDNSTYLAILYGGKRFLIEDNLFLNSDFWGLRLTDLEDSIIRRNRWNTTMFAVSTVGGGSYLFINNTFYDNVINYEGYLKGTYPYLGYGFKMDDAEYLTMYNNTVNGGEYTFNLESVRNSNVYNNHVTGERGLTANSNLLWLQSGQIIVRDMTINAVIDSVWVNGINMDKFKMYSSKLNGAAKVKIENGAIAEFINMTYTYESVFPTSTLNKKWFAIINVTNTSNNPIANVNVTVYENSTGTWIYSNSSLTDSNGMAIVEAIQYQRLGNAKTFFTANITATKGTYYTNTTYIFNISDNTYMDMTLTGGAPEFDKPIITVLSPLNNSVKTNNTFFFNVTTSENCNPVYYSLDGATNVTMNGSATIFYNNITLPDNTKYEVIFYANDTSGNWGESKIMTFTTNSTFVTPENKSLMNITANTNPFFGYLTLKVQKQSGSAWSDHAVVVDSLWTSVAGTTALDTLWYAAGAYTVNESGTFRISAEMKSPNGKTLNRISTEYLNTTYKFTVGDINAPSVTINAPTASFITNETNVTLNYTVTDLTDTTLDCWYTLDGTLTVSPNNPISNGTSDIINLTNLAEGTKTLSVTCEDSLPQNTTSSNRLFTIDLTPPTITLNSPVDNAIIQKGNINFTITITEANTVSNCTIFYRGETEVPYNSILMNYNSLTKECSNSIDMTQYGAGEIISFYYQVIDTANNIGLTGSAGNPLTMSIEFNDPIEFTNPTDNATDTTYNGTDVQLTLTLKADLNVSAYVVSTTDTVGRVWANETLINTEGNLNLTIVWNHTILTYPTAGGTFNWRVWANDTDNNINVSNIYSFTVASNETTTENTLRGTISAIILRSGLAIMLVIFILITLLTPVMINLTKDFEDRWEIEQWIKFYIVSIIVITLVIILVVEIFNVTG